MAVVIFEQGDIVRINFDPSLRHEPAGWHYAVVLSPWEVNRMSALTTLVPVTSTDNGYPLHVKIAEGNPIHGFVQCEGLRAMDLGQRVSSGSLERVGALDDQTLAEVMACVLVVLGVESF